MFSFSCINSLLHFSYKFKHFASKFVTIIIFKWVLRTYLCSDKIECSSHFAIYFVGSCAAIEGWVSKFEHVIVSLPRSRCFFSINVWDENHSMFSRLMTLLYEWSILNLTLLSILELSIKTCKSRNFFKTSTTSRSSLIRFLTVSFRNRSYSYLLGIQLQQQFFKMCLMQCTNQRQHRL